MSLVLLDGALYLTVIRPTRRVILAERQERARVVARVQAEDSRVQRLTKFQRALPDAGDEVKTFLKDHITPRRRCYSHAAHLIRQLAQESGVQLATVSYRLNSTGGDFLQRLGIQMTMDGPFPGMLKFAHGLETSKDFILIRDFAVLPGEGSSLGLRLAADLYLEP